MRISAVICRLALLFPLLSALQATSAVVYTVTPAATTNLVGDSFALELLQDGGAPAADLQFQWSKGNTNLVDGDTISGVQTSILTFRNSTLAESGTYRVNIYRSGALLGASSATVYIVAQPEIQNVYLTPLGAGVTFTVEATGGLLSYQWRWQGQDLPGATSSTLRFTDAYAQANAGYYSVLVTNLLGTATSSPNAVLFTKTAPAGVYQGIYALDGVASPDAVGSFQLTIASSLSTYSGKIYSAGKIWRTSGSFGLDHSFTMTVPRTNGDALTLQMQFITTNDAPQIVGVVTDTNSASTGFVRGYRLYYSLTRPTTLAGRYTLALMNTNWQVLPVDVSLGAPGGDGCAAVVVQKSGLVAISGRTADGTPFTQGWSLSRVGDSGLHAQLLNSREQLIGLLKFGNQVGGNIKGGPMLWFKGANETDRLYPQGFYLNLQPAGSTYVPTNSPILSFTNGVAALYGGDLYQGQTPIWSFSRVYLKPQLKLIPELGPERLYLLINRLNGVITGGFTDLSTGLRAPIVGVVLQQQRAGRGYFVSTNSAGGFTLMPAVP